MSLCVICCLQEEAKDDEGCFSDFRSLSSLCCSLFHSFSILFVVVNRRRPSFFVVGFYAFFLFLCVCGMMGKMVVLEREREREVLGRYSIHIWYTNNKRHNTMGTWNKLGGIRAKNKTQITERG